MPDAFSAAPTNPTTAPEVRELSPDELTPEQRAATEAINAQPVEINPADLPPEVFLSEAKEGRVNPVQLARENRDRYQTDPEFRKRLADATDAVEEQGFEWSDLAPGKMAEGALHMGKSLVEYAAQTPLTLPYVRSAAGGLRKLLSRWDTSDAAVDAATKEGGAEFAAPAIKKGLRFLDEVAEGAVKPKLIAATEGAQVGMAELARKGARKAARMVGAGPRTDEERQARLDDAIESADMAEEITGGEGVWTQRLQGERLEELKKKGIKLDPQAVADLQAGDPLTFFSFGKAFGAGGALVSSTGRVIAKAPTFAAAQATKNALRSAQVAKVAADARLAGIGSAENAAAAEAASANLRAAKAGMTPTASVLAGAEDVAAGLRTLPQKAVGGALWSAGATGQLGAKILGWAGKSAPIVGLVKGFAEGGPIGALAGLKAGEMSSGVIRRGAEFAGNKAFGASKFGKAIFKDAAETPAQQAAIDIARGTGSVAAGATKGLAMDLGLGAATSESPEETAGITPIGAIFGGAHAVPGSARHFLQNQLLAPRNWADTKPVAAKPYGSFPALDTLHAEAQGIASGGVKQRLGALRTFMDPTGVEIYQMPSRGALESFLVEQFQSEGMSAGDALAQAKSFAANAGVFTRLADANGNVRRVGLLVDPAPAPHEAFHGLEDVLGAPAAEALRGMVAKEYGPRWDTEGRYYAHRLAGPTGGLGEYLRRGEDWQHAILDITGAGDSTARSVLAAREFKAKKDAGTPVTPEEALGTAGEQLKALPKGWREVLQPEHIDSAAGRYLASELVAENFDTLFKHENPAKPSGNSLPERFGRIMANVFESVGADPYQGAQSEGLKVQPKRNVMQAVKDISTGVRDIMGKQPKPAEAPKAPTEPPKPGAPEPVTENQTRAQEAAAAGGDARVAELVNRIVANQQAGDAPLRLTYKSVKGLPGGAAEAFRTGRRSEQEAAYIKEALSSMDTDTRNAVQKIHAHTRFDYVRGGKEIQSIGYSLEKLIGNVQRTVDWIRKSGNAELAAQIPYERNTFGTSLSETGWNEFISDVQRYAENQQKGGTGAGAELKLPADVDAMGVTVPAFEGVGAMKPIEQGKADFINMLMGFKLPETTRQSRKGGTPGNIVAQRIAGANEQPFVAPRVSEPALTRGGGQPFRGFSESIKEVNPLRQEFEAKGFPVRELVEVVERINLKHLDAVTAAPEVGFKAGVTDTIRAGFMPEDQGLLTRFVDRVFPKGSMWLDVSEYDTFGFKERSLEGTGYESHRELAEDIVNQTSKWAKDNAGRYVEHPDSTNGGRIPDTKGLLSAARILDMVGDHEAFVAEKRKVNAGGYRKSIAEAQGERPTERPVVRGDDFKNYDPSAEFGKDSSYAAGDAEGNIAGPAPESGNRVPGFNPRAGADPSAYVNRSMSEAFGTLQKAKYDLRVNSGRLPKVEDGKRMQYATDGSPREYLMPIAETLDRVLSPLLDRLAAKKPGIAAEDLQYVDWNSVVEAIKQKDPELVQLSREMNKRAGVRRASPGFRQEFVEGFSSMLEHPGPHYSEIAYPQLRALASQLGSEAGLQTPLNKMHPQTRFVVSKMLEEGAKQWAGQGKNAARPTPFGDAGQFMRAMPEKAADIINMNADEFRKQTMAFPTDAKNGGGLTGMAVDLGSRMTEAQRADFQKGMEDVKARMNERLAEGDFQGSMDLAVKGQFFREAIEAATGGSAADFTRKRFNPDYRGALEPMTEAGRTPAEVKVRAEVENRPVAVGEVSGFRSYTEAQFMPEPAGFDTTPVRETYGKAIEEVAGDRNIWVRQSADKGNENRVLLVQLSSKFMQTEGAGSAEAAGYYDNLYAKREGYTRAPDFWEVPKWQAVATHALGDRADTYVVRNMAEAKKFLKESGYGNVAFSVLDANRANVMELAKEATGRVNLGGYTKELAADAKSLPNAKAFESMKGFVEDLGIEYKSGEDYRNFRGTSVIPRLSLSEGCRHSCTFCSVERKVKTIPPEQVDAQVDSFKDLNANLVYLNDKTFGQAENYKQLPELAERLRKDNPNFDGFVVQTTAAQMKSLTPEFLRESGIKFVEIGVESYNDAILKNSRKPASEKLIDEAIEKLRAEKIAVIPNIVIGLPGETAETYGRTMDFLRRNRDAFSHVNAYNLAVYEGTELSKSLKVKTTADRDENVGNKSFHSDPKLHEDFAKEVYQFANEQLDRTPYQAMPEKKNLVLRGQEEGVRELPLPGKPEFWLRPDGTIKQEQGKGHALMATEELPPEVIKRLKEDKGMYDEEGVFDDSPLYDEMFNAGYYRGRQMGDKVYFENGGVKPMTSAQRKTAEAISFQVRRPAQMNGRQFGYEKPSGGGYDNDAAYMPEKLTDEPSRLPVSGKAEFWIRPDGSVIQEAGRSHFRMATDELGLKNLDANITKEWTKAYDEMYSKGYVRGVRTGMGVSLSNPDTLKLSRAQRETAEAISFETKAPATFNGNTFGYKGGVDKFFVPDNAEALVAMEADNRRRSREFDPNRQAAAMPEKPLFEPSPADEANARDHRRAMDAYEQRDAAERAHFRDRMDRMDYLRGQATGDLIEKHGEDAWFSKPIREREDAIFDRMVELNGGSENFDPPTRGKTQFMPTAAEWEAQMAAERKAKREERLARKEGRLQEAVQEVEEAVGLAGTVQLKRDKKLPGAMGGVLKLIHFGAAGLTSTDPQMMGKGLATPSDMQGGRKTFFFNEGSKMQADLTLRERGGKYGVRVDGNAIYDLNSDSLDILSNPNKLKRDEILKKAGFNGFHVATVDGREVTVLYKPVAVTPIELGRAYTRAVSAPGSKFMPEQETFLGDLGQGRKEYDSAALQRMNREQLKAHYPEAVITKTIGEELTSDHLASPRYRQAKDHAAAVEDFANKLVEYYKANENNPAQKAGEKWYSEFTPLLKKEFGKDAPIFAELLAATSPNTTPTINFGFAQDAYAQFKAGRFDKKVAKFVEGLQKMETGELRKIYDRDRKAGKTKDNPASPSDATYLAHWIDKHDLVLRGAGGNRFGMHSIPVLQVLARNWLTANRGPKTLNFVQNLLGTGHEATIDVWADRTLRRAGYEGFKPRWRITPENSTGVPDVDFNFGQEVFASAAKKLGLKASALQGALWFSEKKHWSDNGWGRLDLGDYRSEMEKLPLLRRGTEQRLKHAAAMEKAKRMEEQDLFMPGIDIRPRMR